MRHKRKEEPQEQKQTKPETGEFTDFYQLLDSLLPQKSELLQDLRSAMEDCKKRSEETLRGNKNEADYVLEIEKEKTKCLLELYKIALNQYLRISADYANFQKRVPRQTADAIAYEKEKIIKTLLPALDNFEHTLQNAPSAENVDVLVKGIRIVYDHMLDILKSHGVEQIKALGEKFDPALHQAVMQKTEPQMEENIVLEELQKGYKLNDHIIQPSKVIVNKPSSEQQAQQAQSPQQPDFGEAGRVETDYETTDTQ